VIFEKDFLVFQILDVLYLDQKNTKTYNTNRNFDALSFRLEADTVIEYNHKKINFSNHSIGFFPADINYTRVAHRDKLIVVHFKTFNYHSNEIQSFYPKDCEKYRLLFEEILECWQKKDTSYLYEASILLNRIFAELHREHETIHRKQSKIEASVQYIEENCYRKDFSLQTAAKKSFISETYFRKLFRQEFSVSPKQYIIQKRIRYAASLILTGYYSLEEVSNLCGYPDYKHFSVEFKKLMGVSPSRYSYHYEEPLC